MNRAVRKRKQDQLRFTSPFFSNLLTIVEAERIAKELGDSVMGPSERIHQAFLHLEFALKVMSLFERHEVDKQSFDRALSFQMPDGVLSFPPDSFDTYSELILAAQNVYSTSIGLSAIALETALQDAGISNNPSDESTSGQLRSLVYQIRCAFAHDLMRPRWSAKSRYRRVYVWKLDGKVHQVDMTALNEQPFELDQIGGIFSYLAIKNEIARWLASRVPSPDAEAATTK